MRMDAEGCWLVYHCDWSGMTVFSAFDEVMALRYALTNHMSMGWLAFGEEMRTAKLPLVYPEAEDAS